MDKLTSPRIESLRHRLVYLIRRYGDDHCRDTAAALTYISLFALVPLLTVLFTIASAVPAFEGAEGSIQELLFKHLVPETSAGLQEYLAEFSRQAKNLTGFGIAVLLVTAILMLRSIEQAFNRIWRTRSDRGAVSSFLLYWAMLSLAPITIGLGLGASTYLAAFAGRLEEWGIMGISSLVLFLAPYLLQIVGFTLVYAAVPNCRVPLRHAAVGGVIASITFNTARALFTKLVAGSSITFIYGAFAAVPLFLLWIYISWNIVLVCAIIIHSLSAYQSDAQSRRPLVLKGLELLESLWQRQAAGEGLREIDLLAKRGPAIDSESWQLLRDRFFDVRLIARDEDGRYRLARDLHEVPLWQLQEWLRDEGDLSIAQGDALPAWEQRAVAELAQRRRANRAHLTVSLAELFGSHAPPDTAPSTRNGDSDVLPARIVQG